MIIIHNNGKERKFKFYLTAMLYCWWNGYTTVIPDLTWYWKTNASKVEIWIPKK